MTSNQDTQCGPGSDIIVSRNSFTVTLVKIVFQISGDHPPHLGLWVKDGFSCSVIVHVEGLTLSHGCRETQDVFEELGPARAETEKISELLLAYLLKQKG